MGFDTDKFVNKVSDDRKCLLCHFVLDNPVKTPCAHVFCSGCVLPWVVKHGCCPFRCQPLGTGDLDNVLVLRELVLNMTVECEFKQNGCDGEIRLKDFMRHIQECDLRPAICRNKGCGLQLSLKAQARHEVHECDFRPVGICKLGCDSILLHARAEKHNCVESLKARVTEHESHVLKLENEVVLLRDQFKAREKELLTKITHLQKRYQKQGIMFANQLRDYESFVITRNNNTCIGQVRFPL